jgi:hypothetical protein
MHFVQLLFCYFTLDRKNFKKYYVRFKVLTVASMKMTAFWDVELYSVTEVECGQGLLQ